MSARLFKAVPLAALLLVVLAAPAAADPPGPTNYDSEILRLDPPVDGLDARVIGGDAFLLLEAEGREVVVSGYEEGEVYLRFDPSGDVYVNLRSRAHYQNQDRYSVPESEIPEVVGPDVAPEWSLVATGGAYAWHDHRIHWMSPTTLPGEVDPTAATEQVAYEWTVDLVVDGDPVTMVGQLSWLPDASPVPALAVAVLALAMVVALAGRWPVVVVAAVAAGAVAAAGVTAAGMVGLDPGVTPETVPLVLPAIGLIVGLAGWSMRSRSEFGIAVAGAGGVPLLLWGLSRLSALTAPIVPPAGVPAPVVRLAVGLALGAGGGALVGGIRHLLGTRPNALDELD